MCLDISMLNKDMQYWSIIIFKFIIEIHDTEILPGDKRYVYEIMYRVLYVRW